MAVAIDHRLAGSRRRGRSDQGDDRRGVRDLHAEGLQCGWPRGPPADRPRQSPPRSASTKCGPAVLPEAKSQIVDGLQQSGRNVAMAGDRDQRRSCALGDGGRRHRHGDRDRHRNGQARASRS